MIKINWLNHQFHFHIFPAFFYDELIPKEADPQLSNCALTHRKALVFFQDPTLSIYWWNQGKYRSNTLIFLATALKMEFLNFLGNLLINKAHWFLNQRKPVFFLLVITHIMEEAPVLPWLNLIVPARFHLETRECQWKALWECIRNSTYL